MLKSITEAVEQTGFVNPMNKVYCLSKQLEQLPLMFALLTINSFEYVYFSAHSSSIMQRPQNDKMMLKCDGPGFIVGMLTIFKQFHPQNENTYMNLLCHYLKNEIYRMTSQAGQKPQTELTRTAGMTLIFLDEIVRFKGGSRETINQMLGSYIFDTYKRAN